MLYQPEVNLRLGTFYFRTLVNSLGGSLEAALAAYNAGKSRADEWLEQINSAWSLLHGDGTRIEAQLERFAPGFRERVLARAVMTPRDIERYNANNAGGDIACGAHSGLQLLMRPTIAIDPYATPTRDIYLCSSATPPGGGVHGMCGYWAAQAALQRLR